MRASFGPSSEEIFLREGQAEMEAYLHIKRRYVCELLGDVWIGCALRQQPANARSLCGKNF
jgi:hypothetical protein